MPAVRFLVVFALWLLALAASAQAPRVAVWQLSDLQRRLAQPTDTTYVVSFWATWCGPCVQELAGFEQVRAATAGRKVRFLLVSLDRRAQLDRKVRPFVARHHLQAEVILLDELNPRTGLASIDSRWTGNIPFTLLYNNAAHQRFSYEHPLTAAELQAALRQLPQ